MNMNHYEDSIWEAVKENRGAQGMRAKGYQYAITVRPNSLHPKIMPLYTKTVGQAHQVVRDYPSCECRVIPIDKWIQKLQDIIGEEDE
tara:strand:- start:549 stop:812 length:264 start_codon:yes stop_codon:yes gene_type:complete